MLTNLLNPWLLARLISGASATLLVLYATSTAWRVLRHWSAGRASEGQLALERRAELVAAIVQAALWIGVFDLALTLVAGDRLTSSVRGAMCAWGVFDASPWGFRALASSTAVAAGCAFWLAVHRLDLRLPAPLLTRRKLAALMVLAPLIAIDLAAHVAFALDLDLTVVASCCSLGLDQVAGGSTAPGGPRELAALSALIVGGLAAVLALITRRWPKPIVAWGAAIASIAGAALALPAIVWYVAPHVYETPTHLCPFCLLHADVLGIGWPLFAALFVAAIAGASLAVLETQRRASQAPTHLEALERSLASWSALGWIAAIAIAVAPVVRYSLATDGASLFGGV